MQQPASTPLPPNLTRLREESLRLSQSFVSANTQLHYGYDWQRFRKWCEQANCTALPATPETLMMFVTDLITQGQRIASVARRAHGVAWQHAQAGQISPLTEDVRNVLRAASRLYPRPPRQMRPLTVEHIRIIAENLKNESTALASRNRAVILIGFSSALRRSTLRELDLSDIEFCRQGIIVRVRREKQDQEGRGRHIGIPYGRDEITCPVRALKEWLTHRGALEGPLFTSRYDFSRRRMGLHGVYKIVKNAMANAGFRPANYGAHSLRAGFVTEAGEAGVNHLLIAAQTGHRSLIALQRYFRRTNVFKENPCSLLNL